MKKVKEKWFTKVMRACATDLGEQLLTEVRARENTKLWAANASKWGVRHR